MLDLAEFVYFLTQNQRPCYSMVWSGQAVGRLIYFFTLKKEKERAVVDSVKLKNRTKLAVLSVF